MDSHSQIDVLKVISEEWIAKLDKVIKTSQNQGLDTLTFERIKSFIQLNLNEDKALDIINKYSEKLVSMAQLDFSKEMEVGEEKDLINFISIGLNMVSDELKAKAIPKYYLNCLEATSDAAAIVNEEGTVTYVNQRFLELLQLTRKQITNRSILPYFYSDSLYYKSRLLGKIENVNTFVLINGVKVPMTFTIMSLSEQPNLNNPQAYIYIAKPYDPERFGTVFQV